MRKACFNTIVEIKGEYFLGETYPSVLHIGDRVVIRDNERDGVNGIVQSIYVDGKVEVLCDYCGQYSYVAHKRDIIRLAPVGRNQ